MSDKFKVLRRVIKIAQMLTSDTHSGRSRSAGAFWYLFSLFRQPGSFSLSYRIRHALGFKGDDMSFRMLNLLSRAWIYDPGQAKQQCVSILYGYNESSSTLFNMSPFNFHFPNKMKIGAACLITLCGKWHKICMVTATCYGRESVRLFISWAVVLWFSPLIGIQEGCQPKG